MNKIFALALIGAVIPIFIGSVNILLGLANSDILKNFGIYVKDGAYSFAQLHPDMARKVTFLDLSIGSVSLFAGIIGVIGGKIGKFKGGILLVVASALSFMTFSLMGAIPFIIFLTSGILAFRENIVGPQAATKQ